MCARLATRRVRRGNSMRSHDITRFFEQCARDALVSLVFKRQYAALCEARDTAQAKDAKEKLRATKAYLQRVITAVADRNGPYVVADARKHHGNPDNSGNDPLVALVLQEHKKKIAELYDQKLEELQQEQSSSSVPRGSHSGSDVSLPAGSVASGSHQFSPKFKHL